MEEEKDSLGEKEVIKEKQEKNAKGKEVNKKKTTKNRTKKTINKEQSENKKQEIENRSKSENKEENIENKEKFKKNNNEVIDKEKTKVKEVEKNIVENRTKEVIEEPKIENSKQQTKLDTEENIKQKQEETSKKELEVEDVKEFKKVETKKKKMLIPIIIVTTLICFLIIFSVIFALINVNNQKILSGITIMGIDVSGLKQEEAIQKLQEITQNKETSDITLKQKEYETTINGKQFSVKFDIEKAVNEAYNIGKDGNIIVNNYNILFTQIFKKDIEIPIYYDEEALNSKISGISSKIPGAVKQSSYYIEKENLIIVRGTTGIKINESEIKKQIINTIKQIESKNDIIIIPVETIEPDDIDLEKIRNEIYKEPENAYVSKNPTTVHPHVNGVDFKISIEEAQKLLQEDKKEYTIPLKITVPSKTIKDLGEEAFPDLIATYTTRYDASNYNRSTNLTIAANKINGTILMPDEIFSYNKIVGARTIQAGYKSASAYAGGKVVQDIGGGICQISSTVYNTALLANLEIVDRSNHQFQSSYVPVSRDATVSWGGLDFKFKNSRKYPIKIVASAKNGVAKVSMYGIKEETEYEVVIQSRVLSYIPYSVKYVEDDSLAEGKEKVEQSGYNGCKSEAYRILKLNGKVVSKTLLSRDTYDAMQRIVRKGTKKVTTKPKKTTTSTDKETTQTSTTQEE